MQPCRPSPAGGSNSIQPPTSYPYAERLAKDSLISRAARALKSFPPAPSTLETFEKLQTLNPQREIPAHTAIPPNAPKQTPQVSDQIIISSILQAPRKSAPDPSGWKYEHLQFMISGDNNDAFSCFISVIRDILNSNVPPEVLQIFKIARLFAFTKNERGDIRPVAAENVLPPGASKAIAIAYKFL